MDRDYAPMPMEYLEEMAILSDEDFGRLMRALLRYAKDGTPIALDGDCRFFAVRVMNKDNYYAKKAAEEAEKAEQRAVHSRKAAVARYAEFRDTNAEKLPEHAQACPSMPEQTNTIQNNSEQIKTNQDNTDQIKSDQNKCITEEYGTKPHGASVLALPLNDNTEFEIYEEDVLLWQETYPAVDVRQELKEMKAWCAANPTLRKTRRGIKRFIVTWLSKEQDRRHAGSVPAKQAGEQHAFVPTEF